MQILAFSLQNSLRQNPRDFSTCKASQQGFNRSKPGIIGVIVRAGHQKMYTGQGWVAELFVGDNRKRGERENPVSTILFDWMHHIPNTNFSRQWIIFQFPCMYVYLYETFS